MVTLIITDGTVSFYVDENQKNLYPQITLKKILKHVILNLFHATVKDDNRFIFFSKQ